MKHSFIKWLLYQLHILIIAFSPFSFSFSRSFSLSRRNSTLLVSSSVDRNLSVRKDVDLVKLTLPPRLVFPISATDKAFRSVRSERLRGTFAEKL